MSTLNDSQISFISDEIRLKKGIPLTLQEDLTDHICCIVEEEMDKGKEFLAAYQIALDRVLPGGIDDIGSEPLLLMTSKSRKRLDQLVRVSGIITITLLLITVILKSFHLPFGTLLLTLTVAVMLFLFLPSLYTRLSKNASKKNRRSYFLGFIGIYLLVIFIFFTITHWPQVPLLLLAASVLIYLAVFPLFFRKRYKTIRKTEI